MPEQGTDILAHFGEDHFLERYQRYKNHIAEWRQQYPKLAAVDLRYDQQVVLEMQKGAATEQTASVNPDSADKPAATKPSAAVPAQTPVAAKPDKAKPEPQKHAAIAKPDSPKHAAPAKPAAHTPTAAEKAHAAKLKEKKRAEAKRAASHKKSKPATKPHTSTTATGTVSTR